MPRGRAVNYIDSTQNKDEIDIIAFLRVLWDYKYVIVAIASVFGIATIIIALTMTPIFRAQVIRNLNESQLGSFLAACGTLIFAIHRAPKPEGLDCRDTPLRSSAVDEVEGLPRGGNPRVKIFILCLAGRKYIPMFSCWSVPFCFFSLNQ